MYSSNKTGTTAYLELQEYIVLFVTTNALLYRCLLKRSNTERMEGPDNNFYSRKMDHQYETNVPKIHNNIYCLPILGLIVVVHFSSGYQHKYYEDAKCMNTVCPSPYFSYTWLMESFIIFMSIIYFTLACVLLEVF